MNFMNLLKKVHYSLGVKITGKYFNIDFELQKAGIIRILLGLLLLVRFFENFFAYKLINGVTGDFWILIISPIIFLLFTIGFFTPLSTFLTFILIRPVDYIFETTTLGSSLTIHLLLLLLLIGSNKYYSIDSVLRIKYKSYNSILSKFQKLIQNDSSDGIRKSYSLIFILYAFTSFIAISFHLSDTYWQKGHTVISLFTNSFLSNEYQFFRDLEIKNTKLILIVSQISVILQSIFQLFMLPLMFLKAGRIFVQLHGLLFFLISLFLINLSYLPYVEIFIWILLFGRIRTEKNKSIVETNQIPDYSFTPVLYKYTFRIYYFFMLIAMFVEIGKKNATTTTLLKNNAPISYLFNISQITTYQLGFDIPDVFNCTDLSMGDTWAVTYRLENNKWKLCPMIGQDGERLNYEGIDILYLHNHNTDVLYFGNTLAYRRSAINKDQTRFKEFHEEKEIHSLIKRRILFDYHKTNQKGIAQYKISVYTKDNPIDCEKGYSIKNSDHRSHVILTNYFTYDGENITQLDAPY